MSSPKQLTCLIGGLAFFWCAAAIADADVSVSLTGPTSGEIASSGHFDAIVTNLGPDTAQDVEVTIATGSQIDVTSRSTPSSPFKAPEDCSFGPPFVCSFGSLAPGESGKVPYNVRFIELGTATSTATTTTSSTDSSSGNDSASVTTVISAGEVDLSISAEGPDAVPFDDVFGYTFTVKNNSAGHALRAIFQYNFPPEIALETNYGPGLSDSGILVGSLPPGTDFSCADSTSAGVICAFELFRAGEDVRITVRVRAIGGPTITNYATVSGEGLTDPDNSNNSTTLVTSILPTANLSLVASSPPNPIVGEQFDYVFTVTNSGPEMATSVVFDSGSMPPEVSFVSAAPASCAGNDPVTCNLGTITSGSDASVDITVEAISAGLASLTGSVASDLADGNEADDSAFSNSVITEDRLPPGADISMSLSGPTSGEIESLGSFDTIVTNRGPETARDVEVTVMVPSQINIISRSTPSSPFKKADDCSFGPPMVCSWAELAPGQQGRVPYRVRFVDFGTAVSTASATTSSTDANTANNSASVTTEIAFPDADLEVTADGPDTVVIGDDFSYSFTVTNNGPGNAQRVVFEYSLPPEIAIDPISGGGFNDGGVILYSVPYTTTSACNSTAAYANCTFEPLRVGEDVRIVVRLDAIGVSSPATSTAQVSGEGFTDPDTTNNLISVATAVVPPNRPPIADDQSVTAEGVTATPISLTGSDPDGDTLSFAVVNVPSNGTLTGIAPNLSYISDPGFLGGDSFTFVSNDGEIDSDTATVSITVVDTTPPALIPPPDITQDATGPLTSVEIGIATATDLVDGAIPPTNNAPSGGYPVGTTVVTWTAVDTSGNVGTATQNVTLTNDPPVLSPIPDATINEGDTLMVTASFADPDSVAWTATVDYGDGAGVQALAVDAATKTMALNRAYADNGDYLVTVSITDAEGAYDTTSFVVMVNNVAPSLSNYLVTPAIAELGAHTVSASVEFTDPGVFDTHTATIDWGDGMVEPATVTETNGSGTAVGDHVYLATGVYTVTVWVTDKDGATSSNVFQFVVVYDPSGGFVTGGGWIDSPLGACQLSAACTTMTGKANFGFVSKYKKGATTPTGNTEFQFKAGDLNFHSSSYDWLVIAGAKAKYKGSGTINGAGNYGFMLSAIDADLTPSTDVDLFRIKIWDKENGDFVVYDNQMAAAEDADPTTVIGGGSIKIHKAKK